MDIKLSKPPILKGLYLVATPIGNLGDISLRALQTLENCDLIACEDTRQSAKLLSHYNIKTKTIAYHDHNAHKQLPKLIKALQDGKSVSLVSDAGTPLISDPGFKLVQACQEKDIAVTTVPGASAVLSALILSGLKSDSFTFLGFFPQKKGEAEKLLARMTDVPATLIFFESAKRLTKTLQILHNFRPDCDICVARELTKIHEDIKRGKASELIDFYQHTGPPKGELVLLIEPIVVQPVDAQQLTRDLSAALDKMSLKEAVDITAKIYGRPRREIYRQALSLKDGGDTGSS